jgi:6-phosphogluconolactonase
VALPFALRGVLWAQTKHAQLGMRGRPSWIFLGTDSGKGIYRATWNFVTGTMGPVELAAETVRPAFLARHPKLVEVMYAVNSTSGPEAAVSSFHVDTATGALTPLNRVGSQGDGPCFISVDSTGEMAFVANYAGGSLAAFRVTNVGALAQAIGVFKYTQQTHGPVAERQDAAHIHCAVVDPANRYVLACDLGDDVILVFPIGPGLGDYVRVPLRVQARAGSGPRHVAFHPNAKWVYCIHEIDSTIDLYDWSVQGNKPAMMLREGSVVSTIAKGVGIKGNTACEMVVSNDGRFVYSCTRGVDTIEVWRVDESTGLLTLVQRVSSGGKVPRYIAFDPSKKWLVCCNQGGSGNVAVFSRDAATGRLGVRPKVFQANTPMFALWV